VAYRGRASATRPATRVLALNGLTLGVACRTVNGETQARFSIRSSTDATLRGTSIATASGSTIKDPGGGPNGGPTAQPEVSIVQGSLPAGRTLTPDGLRAGSGVKEELDNIIYTTRGHVVSVNLAVTVESRQGSCSVTGTAVPA
jgi:hypothetical protein